MGHFILYIGKSSGGPGRGRIKVNLHCAFSSKWGYVIVWSEKQQYRNWKEREMPKDCWAIRLCLMWMKLLWSACLVANTSVHWNAWLTAWNCNYPCHVSFSRFTDMDASTYSLHRRGNSICYKLLWKPEFYFRVVHYFNEMGSVFIMQHCGTFA
jgi:hypothetical protein